MRALVASALLALAAWSPAVRVESSAAETLRFHLCGGFVEAAALAQSIRVPEEWFVHVKPTPAGTSALEEFTRSHLGDVAQVVVSSSLVVEAKIQTIVDSGRIQSAARKKPAAEALAELLASPPSAPCGVESLSGATDSLQKSR